MVFDYNLLFTQLLALFLPWVRILAFLQFSPVIDSPLIPKKFRVVLSLVLTGLLAPLLPAAQVPLSFLSPATLLLILEQIGWGFLFGQMLQLAFSVLQGAGQIIAMNMGLSMAVQNDPINGSSNTVVSQLFHLTAVLTFFAANGHLLLITVLYKGFIYWPPGEALAAPSLQIMVGSVGWMISSAMVIALPSTLMMLLVQGAFGLLNRISPALNLYSLGFPVVTLAGLVTIALLLPSLSEHYLALTNHLIHQFDLLRGSDVSASG